MIVLDTNVLSEPLRPDPSPVVEAWTASLVNEHVCTTAVTVGELSYGIARLPEGKRKAELSAGVTAVLAVLGEDNVLSYDRVAAGLLGGIIAERERMGRPIHRADAQIASICRATGATLATRDTADFDGLGLTLINPWEYPASQDEPIGAPSSTMGG